MAEKSQIGTVEKPDIIDTVAHHNETVESDIHIKAGVSGRIQTACAKNIGMRCSSRHDLQPADVLADAASADAADLADACRECEAELYQNYSFLPVFYESCYYAEAKGVSGVQFHPGSGRVSFINATRT